jgi:hypothetical protein
MLEFQASDPSTLFRVLQALPRTLKLRFVLLIHYPVGMRFGILSPPLFSS